MRLSRFWLWRVPAAIAGLAALLFLAGFGLALRGSLGEPLGVVERRRPTNVSGEQTV